MNDQAGADAHWLAALDPFRALGVTGLSEPSEPLDFILETRGDLAAAGDFIAGFNARYETDGARAERLFRTDAPELAPFVLVSVTGVTATAIERSQAAFAASAFAAGNALCALYGLASAEPDLPQDYFLTWDDPGDGDPGGARAGERIVPFEAPIQKLCEVDVSHTPPFSWAPDNVGAAAAIAYSRSVHRPSGGRGVKIGHLDTGFTDHVELAGCIDPSEGWDELEDTPRARDPLKAKRNKGHGTATASVATSRPIGAVFGIAPEAIIYPIRCIKDVKVFHMKPVARAIERAMSAGVQIISMSFGGVPSRAVRAALNLAVSKDIVVVAAAGNCIHLVVWPARYSHCIAVAGSNNANLPWKGTCRGDAIDFAAPAEFVGYALYQLKDAPNPPTRQGQGTSFAAATSAGAAAQWIAHHGSGVVAKIAAGKGVRVQDLFRAAVRASCEAWRQPTKFGPGIVRVDRLLQVDPGALHPTQPSLMSGDAEGADLAEIYEAFGGDPGAMPAFDWTRHGAELAAIALRRALHARVEDVALADTAALPASPSLQSAVRAAADPPLRRWAGVAP